MKEIIVPFVLTEARLKIMNDKLSELGLDILDIIELIIFTERIFNVEIPELGNKKWKE